MHTSLARFGRAGAVLFALVLWCQAPSPAEQLQILRNGGFEEDELTMRGEPASSCGGYCNDQWYNMQDKFPDAWTWPGVYVPGIYSAGARDEWPRPEVTLDPSAPRSGKYALRLKGKSVRLQQSLAWNRLVDVYADISGSNWGLKDHSDKLVVRDGLFADLVLEGWVRTTDVPDDAKGTVTVSLGRAGQASFDMPKGSTDWTKFQVALPAADQAKGVKKNAPGKSLSVTISYTSPGAAGQVWLDDLSLSLAERPEPNLLPNASFEQVADGSGAAPATGRGSNVLGANRPAAETPYPEGWSAPMKWLYLPPPTYYVWANWQHFFGSCRGAPRTDRLVARTGRHSLRLDLLPGDEYALESPTMALNQTEARPVELTAWARADRLRHLDFMLLDQDGRRVPTNPTLTYWGGQLSGTYGWVAVRRVFQGFEPIKSCRLRIGGRGFNGTTKTDIGHWHAYNQVSTVWLDDLAVREVYSTAAELAQRGVTVPPAEAPKGSMRLGSLDLGERLYGENEITAELRNDSGAPASAALEATLVTPSGEVQKARRGRTVKIEPGQSAVADAPYTLTELSPSWRKTGQLRVGLLLDGNAVATETYSYGTWPAVANIRPSKAALDETENPILVAINLGLARDTLAKVKSLSLQVIDRRNGKAAIRTKIKRVPEALASAKITPADKDRFYFYMPRVGLLDHRNLILTELDISELPVRPWNDPESDWLIRVSSGRVFTADSHPFARLTKFDEALEPAREVTVDPEGHFLRVNGKPYFVFAHSHANGAANGGAPKSRSVSFAPERAKVNAMNGLFRWAGLSDTEKAWQANLYVPMLMAIAPKANNVAGALKQLEEGKLTMANNMHHAPIASTVEAVNSNPAGLGVFVSMSEAIVADSPDLRAQAQYADALRRKLKRPLGIMDNHSQFYPWNAEEGGILDHLDLLFLEREEGSLFRPELSARDWMKRRKTWMICDLPQTYENVPHARARYQALKNTLHGARGWFGIQGCADPSLYRLLGGELRHIFTYLSANEGRPEVSAPEGITAKAWRKGERVLVVAEQHNPVPRGKWEWRTGIGGRAMPAHTGTSRHIVTPVKGGYAVHGYNDDTYREVAAGDAIQQEVYVGTNRKPQAIFLVVPGNNDFSHVAYWGTFDWNDFHGKRMEVFLAGECYSMAAYGINCSRSKDPEFLKYQAQRRFPASCFVKMGDLPEPGEWTSLSVPLDKLGLTGKVVDGLLFMTSGDGLAWWGKSAFVRKDGSQEIMLEGRIGRDPEQFRQARLGIDGLGDGTIRVVGESRSLALTDGTWTDDLMGEDLYDCFGDGWLGDGITYRSPVDSVPEALELSYTYDNSPKCVRVYEVTPK